MTCLLPSHAFSTITAESLSLLKYFNRCPNVNLVQRPDCKNTKTFVKHFFVPKHRVKYYFEARLSHSLQRRFKVFTVNLISIGDLLGISHISSSRHRNECVKRNVK